MPLSDDGIEADHSTFTDPPALIVDGNEVKKRTHDYKQCIYSFPSL